MTETAMYPSPRRLAKPWTRAPAALMALLVLALGAGCTREAPPPVPRLAVAYDRPAEMIVVRVRNLPAGTRVTAIRLDGPDGRRVTPRTRRLRRGVSYEAGRPNVGVTARGGSSTGITPGISLSWDVFDWDWGAPSHRKLREVIAEIPAPADYLSPESRAWRVTVTLRDAAGTDRQKVAPAPG